MPALIEAAERLGGRLTANRDGELRVSFGSPLRYRLLGAILPGGLQRVPLDLGLEVEPLPEGSWSVAASIEDAKGWYLMNETPLHRGVVNERTAEIIAALRAASASPATDAAGR